MMKTRILTALLMLCCTVPSWAQVWSRAYGGPGSELGKFIEPTRDGGFYVAGTQSAVQQGPERFYVARFDSNGTRLWEKTYGKPGMTHTLFAFSTTSDGGFMVGGFTGVQFSGTESALMYRADSNGNVVFENDVDYSDSDHWHLLLERPDGGYYMGGHTDSKGDSRGDMWLQKLDAQRRVIWEKVYDRNTSEHAHGGVITRDGGVMLLGHTESGGREKYWAVKVDSSGTVQWQKVFGSEAAYHDSPYKVFETAEGNFAFIGGSSDPSQGVATMWLLVVDPDGDILIDEHYGDAAAESFSWSGRQTSDGGYILAGYTTYRTRGETDLLVVKTDAQGNLEWEEKHGGTGYDYAFDVIEVPTGYIAAGYTGSPSIMTGGGGDLYVVKVAPRVAAPGAVVLVSPANGSTLAGGSAELIWSAAMPDVDRYRVDVSSSSSFTSWSSDTTITGTSTTLSGLEPGKTYWWRVKAHNSAGWGPFSEVRSFVISSTTTAPNAIAEHSVSLRVAPNPAADRVTISYSLAHGGPATIAVLDERGRTLSIEIDDRAGQGERRRTIDLSTLPQGVYTIRIVSSADAAVHSERITVVR